mmetsp:Transcript_72664/g.183968  ORF Transcript_72664/g.183968 Transcript_72664/m.183968 type:complete len:210 (+) Transcript_72664:735-1364(+)
MAASLQTLAMSAPAKPGVKVAMRCATDSIWRVVFNFTGLKCTMKMSLRSSRSGRSTAIMRSKRPGRSSAASKMSDRFVPASTTTPRLGWKPSISTSIWFKVPSRSSLPPMPPPLRLRPMASISSMKTMHGACLRASAKRSRTRRAPTPTNISSKSEPEACKKGTPASPAIARANRVLPVPGGPDIIRPFGSFAPKRVKRSGSFKYRMIS